MSTESSSKISCCEVLKLFVVPVENLNQIRTDRRTVELRFSWEGVLNHTWISPWTQKGILLCEKDPGRDLSHMWMKPVYKWIYV